MPARLHPPRAASTLSLRLFIGLTVVVGIALASALAYAEASARLRAQCTADQRRSFDLASVSGEVLTLLSPSPRGAACSVALNAAPGLQCDSFPGAYGQLLSNLIMSAVLHGYADGGGVVSVAIRRLDAHSVQLRVGDLGCGMTEEVLRKMFDLFFTTGIGARRHRPGPEHRAGHRGAYPGRQHRRQQRAGVGHDGAGDAAGERAQHRGLSGFGAWARGHVRRRAGKFECRRRIFLLRFS